MNKMQLFEIRAVAHRIRAPWLFYFETLHIFNKGDFTGSASTVDKSF